MESLGNLLNKHSVTDSEVTKVTNTDTVASGQNKVDAIADKLVGLFNNPTRRMFYCKVGWKLSEAQIWNNYELALSKGREPVKYFTYLCNKDMKS